MVFQQSDSLNIALFIAKGEVPGRTLRREDARKLALREIKAAGLAPLDRLEIEAFENEDGWMVFASTCVTEPERCLWVRFDAADDFLDAYPGLLAYGLQLSGWPAPDGGFILLMKGPVGKIKAAGTYIKEFAAPFDAPECFALHLAEQTGA